MAVPCSIAESRLATIPFHEPNPIHFIEVFMHPDPWSLSVPSVPPASSLAHGAFSCPDVLKGLLMFLSLCIKRGHPYSFDLLDVLLDLDSLYS